MPALPNVYTGGRDGLRVFDASEPENIKEVGFDEGYPILSLWVTPPYAYEACGTSGLWIADILDPSNPHKVGMCDTKGYAEDIFVSERLAYIADYDGLQIVLTVPPSGPQKMGFCPTSGDAWSVWVSGSYAYIADGEAGLQVFDVSNPNSPALMNHYSTEFRSFDVCVSGNLLFLGAGFILIFDISDPANPIKITSLEMIENALYVKGSLLYSLENWGEKELLKVINISDPLNSEEIGFYSLPSPFWPFPNRVWTLEDYIYVVLPDAGLFVLQYYGPKGRKEKPTSLHYPSLTISPNPTEGNLRISYNLPKRENITISLYDATGRVVKILERSREEAGVYNKVFDIDNFKPGVYFLRFEGESLDKRTEKVIIM